MKQLTHNAFRILGLQAGATQAQIDDAARLMRVCTDQIPLPHAPYDVPALGAVPRRSIDIEYAVSRLNQPESRIQERVWWFFSVPAAGVEFSKPPAGALVEQIHAAALFRLQYVLATEGAARIVTHWTWLLDDFSLLAESREFGSLLAGVETQGAFDKRAQPMEIRAAQSRMSSEVAGLLIEEVQGAARADDLLFVSQILALLGSSDRWAEPRQVLARGLEDLLVAECGQVRDDVHVAWQRREIDSLSTAAQTAARRSAASLEPLLRDLLHGIPAADIDSPERLASPVCQLLDYIAQAHEACYDYVAAEGILERALRLARGGAMGTRLSNQLESMHLKADKQRASFFYAAAQFNKKRPPIALAPSRRRPAPQALANWGSLRYLWPILVLLAIGFSAVVMVFIAPASHFAGDPVALPRWDVGDTQPAGPATTFGKPRAYQTGPPFEPINP